MIISLSKQSQIYNLRETIYIKYSSYINFLDYPKK